MLRQPELLDGLLERIQERLQEFSKLEDVEVLVTEPDRRGHSQRLYVVIDSSSVIAHIGFWSNRTISVGALDLRDNNVLLDYSCTIHEPQDINRHLDRLLQTFFSHYEGAIASLAL